MRLRLNAGNPATVPTGRGVSAPPPDETDELKHSRSANWAPNREADVLLSCGDSIPWPAVSLLGKQSGRGNHGDVWCSEHGGWFPVAEKEKTRARKGMAQWANTQHQQNQSLLPMDDCPF